MHKPYQIRIADWHGDDQQLLKEIRQVVFIDEQQVLPTLEWDGLDTEAVHLLALDVNTQQAIACARITKRSNLNQSPTSVGYIGRMAVLKHWRNQSVGSALLSTAIKILQKELVKEIRLSAQTHAITFYQKAGFVVQSQPYVDAGITHVEMQFCTET